jgi:hypothetical protein
MHFDLQPHHRNTPDQELIDDLAKVAASLSAKTVTIEAYNEHGRFHATTLTRRFGSWFKALELAGLERTRNLNISNEDLLQNLVEVWTTLGSQPRYNDLTKEVSRFSVGTYENRFGSWTNALSTFITWANEGQALLESPESSSEPRRRTHRSANWRQRAIVLMRDGAVCRLCGARPPTAKLHVDHIKPWSSGGETVVENLQILCEQCNIGKSDLVIEQP